MPFAKWVATKLTRRLIKNKTIQTNPTQSNPYSPLRLPRGGREKQAKHPHSPVGEGKLESRPPNDSSEGEGSLSGGG